MAADKYYDAVGEVLSYVLSAGDIIKGHNQTNKDSDWSEERLVIRRDGVDLELRAPTDQRYFKIIHSFRISQLLNSTYDSPSTDLLQTHMEEYDVDDQLMRDDSLEEIVIYRRLEDVDTDQAGDLFSGLDAEQLHSECRLRNEWFSAPDQVDEEVTYWDGIRVVGMLYPYEDNFGPRSYERVAQNVISMTGFVESEITDLDVVEETDYEPVSSIP